MAINDFSNQNIQDTYQRVIQTDGTNVADGTGSLLPISFDGNDIIVPGAVRAQSYIVSQSVLNISSGSTAFGDTSDDSHAFVGSITASGNISASGNILAGGISHILGGDVTIKDDLIIGDDLVVVDDVFIGNRITGVSSITSSGDLLFTNESTANITANENLTINIENTNDLNSTIFKIHNLTQDADIFQFLEEGIIYAGKPGGDATLASHGDMTFMLDLDNNETNQKFTFKNFSTVLAELHESSGFDISTNITASGNISSSGIITAEHFESSDDITAAGTIQAEQLTSTDDASVAGDLVLGGAILHSGDIDTKIEFTTDQIDLQTGGAIKIRLANTLNTLNQDTKVSGNLEVTSHITASSNISSSGTVQVSDSGYFIGTQVPPALSIEASRLRISSSNDIFYDSADDHIFMSEGTEVVHIRGDETILEVTGDIDLSGNLELGHASDTTIARVSSGVISVEDAHVKTQSLTIKVLPNQFQNNPDTGRPAFIHDAISNTLAVRGHSTADDFYAFVEIPPLHKVTHVQVHASANTSNAAIARSFNYQTGADNAISETQFDFNDNEAITNIPSTATQDLVIKCTPGANTVLVYGATVTLALI